MTSHNLGLLVAFPAEIRAEVWRNLRPSTPSTSGNTPKRKDTLGILRACRQLNQEIMPYLYDKEILNIRVEPIWSKCLTVENEHGAIWSIANTRDLLYNAFFNLPYRKLKLLRVSINAPETGNLIQLISLSNHVRDLVHLLEQSNGLPSLEIHLLDSQSPSGKWAKADGTPKNTVTRGLAWNTVSSDYETVLLPFCRLRGVPQVHVHVPEDLTSEENMFKNIEKVLGRTSLFGSVLGDENYWDDNNIQEMLDDKFIDLETELDELLGEDANMMRLERFMFWYNDDGISEYVKKWERISREPHAQDSFYPYDVGARHDWLLTLNPLSAGMQKMRLQLETSPSHRRSEFPLGHSWSLHDCKSYFDNLSTSRQDPAVPEQDQEVEMNQDEEAASRLRTCWSRTAWKEYHKLGIPPLVRYANDLDFMAIQREMEEAYRFHQDPIIDSKTISDGYTLPLGVEQVKLQVKYIDFEAGERTREALKSLIDNIHANCSDGTHSRGLGLGVCNLWDRHRL
ncbi:hypothetical protein ACEPPN_001495 [Leptodophora sp. 'Broadleaf-Isolate-01']